MVVLDAMPHRALGPERTPNLWRQAAEGGYAPQGGRSLPVSVTYANHAAFVTGVDPAVSGRHGSYVWTDEEAWGFGPDAGPGAPTLFDRVAAAGRRSVAVAGDQHLVGQMGAGVAPSVWPPGGVLPDGVEQCLFGYATDREVVAAAAHLDFDADLVVLHLNEVDTISHMYGPDAPEARERYAATDAAYGALVEMLADRWDDTVMITLSDHDQETVTEFEPVRLVAALAGLDGVAVAPEGTAALVRRAADAAIGEPELLAAVRAVPGVEAVAPLAPGWWSAWVEPGRTYDDHGVLVAGQHGSPRCRTQLAVVSGGHPATAAVARGIGVRPPSALDWAPLVAELLDLPELDDAAGEARPA